MTLVPLPRKPDADDPHVQALLLDEHLLSHPLDIPVPLRLRDQLTVEAWVECETARPETLQPLVSQWAPSSSFDRFAGYDAGVTDGQKSRAYFGAVYDGRYVYFSPQHYEGDVAHGIVLRFDTHGDFKSPSSYAAHNAGHTSGLETQGYYGAAFDGRFVYFVPRQDASTYHSRVLRYDTRKAFKDSRSWDAFDVGEAHSQQGAAFDGRYLYFCPGFAGDPRKEDTHSARIIRFDTRGNFKDRKAWASFEAGRISGLAMGCFDGGAFDGRYIYFVPLLNGKVMQYDTRGDFLSPQSWRGFDAAAAGMGMCVGAVFDGRHLFFVPYAGGTVVRFDTRSDFTQPAAWTSHDVSVTQGLDTGGFDGGFYDGRYVYFVPFVSRNEDGPGYMFHSHLLRYDTRLDFDDSAAWEARDAGRTDRLATIGYNAGAFDGRFFYMAPWRDGTGRGGMHGRILRYDTLDDASLFSLRYGDYGHNGGLCAAVPGPSFIVNTAKGTRTAAAHKVPKPGRHYLAGVYDGKTIKLFVDGVLAQERAAIGALRPSPLPLSLGQFHNGSCRFEGIIHAVRISAIARPDAWIHDQKEWGYATTL